MNREEYAKYFNDRQPSEMRKISSDCLIIFEQERNYKESYYKVIDLMQEVREWIQTKNDSEWAKIANEIQKRNRPTYDFYAYRKQIAIKPGDAKPFLPFAETYIGKSQDKTYWAYDQDDRKKNYFSKEALLKEFIDINLTKNNKENVILHMMEKYGGSFVENAESKDVINDFVEEQKFLKKILNLIKKHKEFPYKKTTKHNINHFISNNEEFVILQSQFIQKVNKARIKRPLIISKTKTKDIYDYYDYPIHLIYDYLDEIIINKTYAWRRCLYCNTWFYAKKKNITCCCPDHSTKMRKKRYNKK